MVGKRDATNRRAAIYNKKSRRTIATQKVDCAPRVLGSTSHRESLARNYRFTSRLRLNGCVTGPAEAAVNVAVFTFRDVIAATIQTSAEHCMAMRA
jgi:hypothetical protein